MEPSGDVKERMDAALFLLRWLSVQLYLEEVDTAKTEVGRIKKAE